MQELPTLPQKQRAILVFIKTYMDTNQAAPTIEDIRQHFHHKSLSNASHYLHHLEAKGFIVRNKHFARSIGLTDRALKFLRNIMPQGDTMSLGNIMARTLPILGIVQAGPEGILNYYDTAETLEVPPSVYRENRYALNVQGDSMIDAHIQEGDHVVVEKVQNLPINQIVIVLLNDNAYIKRLIRDTDGTLILRSENPKYQDIIVDSNDRFSVEGKVVHLFREM
ncbi:repressor LexA [candidate division KSB3 bacterium]|uniref:Repressor LexA n=1 Tax=candidate division KSB3 bacterium TaxID=2044937 RepID=A0A2G6KBH7_9BACT|nr:MAG: repressor LexA [candidate division KSB3 bacterium]